MQRIHGRRIELVLHAEVFCQAHIFQFEVALDQVGALLSYVEGKQLPPNLEAADGMRRMQFKMDPQMIGHLGAIRVGAQRDGKIRLQVFYRNAFVVLDLHAFGAIGGNGGNLGGKVGVLAGLLRTALALQQPRIDTLLLQAFIKLFRASPLQNDRRNAHRAIPDRKIGDSSVIGQGKVIGPFLNVTTMVLKDLPDKNPGIAALNANADLHLAEREDRGIRLLLVAGQQHAGIAQDHCRHKHQKREH